HAFPASASIPGLSARRSMSAVPEGSRMSPIALFVLTGVVGPMASDRIAHPDRYQTTQIPPIAMPRSAEYNRELATEGKLAASDGIMRRQKADYDRAIEQQQKDQFDLEMKMAELNKQLSAINRLLQQLNEIDRMPIPEVERDCRRQKAIDEYFKACPAK